MHHHVLALPYELVLSLHNRLQELQILHVSAVTFYASNKVLNDFLIFFIAQGRIVLEYCTYRLRLTNLKPNSKQPKRGSKSVLPQDLKTSPSACVTRPDFAGYPDRSSAGTREPTSSTRSF